MTKGLQVQILHASVQVQHPYSDGIHGAPITVVFFSHYGGDHVIELYDDGRTIGRCTVNELKTLLAARDAEVEKAKLNQAIAESLVQTGTMPVTPPDTPEGQDA